MVLGILFFIIGLAVGSFLNVCIWRIPKGQSIISPNSYCPRCKRPIKFYDNIPVVSYILLGGRCRSCKERISIRYPLVELLTASFFLLAYILYWQTPVELIGFIILSSVLIVLSFIDFATQTLPDTLTLPLIILGIAFSFFRYGITVWQSLVGMLLGGGIIYLVGIVGTKLFRKEAMGGGDIKLMAALGAFEGPIGILFVIFFAAFIGALFGGLGMLFTRDKKKTTEIPWGPYIAIAAIIVHLFGEDVIRWYMSLFLS